MRALGALVLALAFTAQACGNENGPMGPAGAEIPTSLAAIAALPSPGAPSGNGVTPAVVPGDINCATLNDDNSTYPGISSNYGFRLTGAPNGEYLLTSAFGTLTGDAPGDPLNSIAITNGGEGTQYFKWNASLEIDAVIVKASEYNNVFVYVPEEGGDTGLHGVVNPDGGEPFPVSHVEFCYDYELSAEKTATAEYTREYTWEITKSVSPDTHSGMMGENFASTYTVVLDQAIRESGFRVSGLITVTNFTPFNVSFDVEDWVDGVQASVDCDGEGGTPLTSIRVELRSGERVVCAYSAALGSKTDGTNVATITSNTEGMGGATAQADYSFGDPTTVIGYPEVRVSDTNEIGPWYVDGDASISYGREFICSTDGSLYRDGVYRYSDLNTATIDETGQADDATVDVTCYAVNVSKTAAATYDEVHTWDIEKSADPAFQSGYPGDELNWTWTVVVSETFVEENWVVRGVITVDNPSGEPVTVWVSDVLNDGTSATVDCGDGTPELTVPASGSAYCDYIVNAASGTAGSNTATVTLNGVDASATADLTWNPNAVNGTATVTDDQIGVFATINAGGGPWVFTGGDQSHVCSTLGGDYGPDGSYSGSVQNTAVVVGSEGQTDEASTRTSYTCEAGYVEVLKTTNGAIRPDLAWSFALYLGLDGFGSEDLGLDSTQGAGDGILDFGYPALRPDESYTLCEFAVPAGYASHWMVGTATLLPYNPDADGDPPEDLGNRCVDFGAGTSIPVSVGQTVQFVVDNTQPGGDPRTPGYWKNWNTCTGGGQAENAARNGGWEEGFWLLNDVLDPGVGGGVAWNGFEIVTCEDAVSILDQRDLARGKKMAKDGAYTLAMHLLAAQLNFGAGACITQEALNVALEAEGLLVGIDFDGTGSYLRPRDPSYAYAMELGHYLDLYNNGEFCGSLLP